MIRAFVRHLNKAGMSPEAIREMKPYIVRFVEDVRSGKESLDGVPVAVHGGDAGSEPKDVPPAAGQRGMEFSVAHLPYLMSDDLNPFSTVENLERHLAELRAMPDFMFKDSRIAQVQRISAQKKRLEPERKTQE
jgi:hypothetical protein